MSVNLQKQKAANLELISDSKLWIIGRWFFGGFFNKILLILYFISCNIAFSFSSILGIPILLLVTAGYVFLIRYKIKDLKNKYILKLNPTSLELHVTKVGDSTHRQYIPLKHIRNIRNLNKSCYSFQYGEHYDEQLETIEFHSHDNDRFKLVSMLYALEEFNENVTYLGKMVQYAKKKTNN